jgi:hypothetical protein
MIRPIEQISILDHIDLVGTARFGVRLTPGMIAARVRREMSLERAFDDLGFFEFLGVRTDKGRLGFRRHEQPDDRQYSYVACVPSPGIDPLDLISEVCGIERAEIVLFDDAW